MMGSWQDWIVALLVVFCFVRLGISIWSMFLKSKGARQDPCEHCPQPCDVKRLYDKKVANCGNSEKKTKKSCCE